VQVWGKAKGLPGLSDKQVMGKTEEEE